MDGDDNNDAVEEVTVGKEKKKLGWDIVKHLYKKYWILDCIKLSSDWTQVGLKLS